MPGGVLAAPAQFTSCSSSAEKLVLGVVEKIVREGKALGQFRQPSPLW
jgi:hypothetical protein